MNILNITQKLSEDASIRIETVIDNSHYIEKQVIKLHIKNGYQFQHENNYEIDQFSTIKVTKEELIEFKDLLETLLPLLED